MQKLISVTMLLLALLASTTQIVAAQGRVIDLTWQASPMLVDCEGPTDIRGRRWFRSAFDDSTWTNVTLPAQNDIPRPGDRFYRATFTAPTVAAETWIQVASDDGIWIYINNKLVEHWGGECHEAGCVGSTPWFCLEDNPWRDIEITHYLIAGQQNTIAVHVSNQELFDTDHGNWSYFDSRLYQRYKVYSPYVVK